MSPGAAGAVVHLGTCAERSVHCYQLPQAEVRYSRSVVSYQAGNTRCWSNHGLYAPAELRIGMDMSGPWQTLVYIRTALSPFAPRLPRGCSRGPPTGILITLS